MRTPEGKIKDKVKALLTEHGAYQFWPVQMGYGKRTLDCLVCHYGRFLAIETKRPGKALTPLQQVIAVEMSKTGGTVLRVNSEEELVELKLILESIERPYRQALERNDYLKARG